MGPSFYIYLATGCSSKLPPHPSLTPLLGSCGQSWS